MNNPKQERKYVVTSTVPLNGSAMVQDFATTDANLAIVTFVKWTVRAGSLYQFLETYMAENNIGDDDDNIPMENVGSIDFYENIGHNSIVLETPDFAELVEQLDENVLILFKVTFPYLFDRKSMPFISSGNYFIP